MTVNIQINTEAAFERIKDKINDLYINEEQKDEYKTLLLEYDYK